MNNYGKTKNGTSNPALRPQAVCSFSHLSKALKSKYRVITIEKESDFSFFIPTVSRVKRLMASGDLGEKFAFGPLATLANAVMENTTRPEEVREALKKTPVPRRTGWRSVQSDIARRVETTRPSRRRAATLLCLHLAARWLATGNDHFVRGINHSKLASSKEKDKDARTSKKKFHAALHLSMRSDMTRCPRVDQVATFWDDTPNMEQMVHRMWKESIAPDCESGYLPDFHVKY
jgi:hypothetical protein